MSERKTNPRKKAEPVVEEKNKTIVKTTGKKTAPAKPEEKAPAAKPPKEEKKVKALKVGQIVTTNYPATYKVLSITDKEVCMLDITENARSNGVHFAYIPFNAEAEVIVSSVNKKDKEKVISIA